MRITFWRTQMKKNAAKTKLHRTEWFQREIFISGLIEHYNLGPDKNSIRIYTK